VLRQEAEEEHRLGIQKQESKIDVAAVLNAGRERLRALQAVKSPRDGR
jgi:hypothetical protein